MKYENLTDYEKVVLIIALKAMHKDDKDFKNRAFIRHKEGNITAADLEDIIYNYNKRLDTVDTLLRKFS